MATIRAISNAGQMSLSKSMKGYFSCCFSHSSPDQKRRAEKGHEPLEEEAGADSFDGSLASAPNGHLHSRSYGSVKSDSTNLSGHSDKSRRSKDVSKDSLQLDQKSVTSVHSTRSSKSQQSRRAGAAGSQDSNSRTKKGVSPSGDGDTDSALVLESNLDSSNYSSQTDRGNAGNSWSQSLSICNDIVYVYQRCHV